MALQLRDEEEHALVVARGFQLAQPLHRRPRAGDGFQPVPCVHLGRVEVLVVAVGRGGAARRGGLEDPVERLVSGGEVAETQQRAAAAAVQFHHGRVVTQRRGAVVRGFHVPMQHHQRRRTVAQHLFAHTQRSEG
jgi:hypothetical protein